MFLCWYERARDGKGSLTFLKRSFQKAWKPKKYQHFHNSIELAFLIEGRLDVMTEDREFTLTPGDVCYIESFRRHKYLYHSGTVAYVVLIDPSLFNEKNELGSICFAECSHPTGDFSEMLEFLDFAYKKRDLDSLLFKSAFVDTLTYFLKRNYQVLPKEKGIRQETPLFASVRYISDHAKENLHVADVAQKFGYTPNYYSSIFKKTIGISFRDFLNQCRISELHRLRSEGKGLSVEKLIEMCGFGSLNAYYRTEKKLEQFNN